MTTTTTGTSRRSPRPASMKSKAKTPRGAEETPKKATYNPFRYERMLELVSDGREGIIVFRTQSFTDNKNIWHPTIDTISCRVECDCTDFKIRKYPSARRLGEVPTCYSPHLCKHLIQAVALLKQMGRIPEINDFVPPEAEAPTDPKQVLPSLSSKSSVQRSGVELILEAVRAKYAEAEDPHIAPGHGGISILSDAIEVASNYGDTRVVALLSRFRDDLREALFYMD